MRTQNDDGPPVYQAGEFRHHLVLDINDLLVSSLSQASSWVLSAAPKSSRERGWSWKNDITDDFDDFDDLVFVFVSVFVTLYFCISHCIGTEMPWTYEWDGWMEISF